MKIKDSRPLVQTATNDYVAMLRSMRKYGHDTDGANKLRIGPITFICTLATGRDRIDIDAIRTNIKDIRTHMRVNTTPSRSGRVFYNQLTLWYRDFKSKKSIKIFANGKLQITGLTGYVECYSVCEYTSQLIQRLTNIPRVRISDHYVAMINCNFKWRVGVRINLRTMCDVLNDPACNDEGRWFASYNPESYPAINAKYVHTSLAIQSSAFIFSTGSIVITAGRSIKDLHMVYASICGVIGPAYDSRQLDHPIKEYDATGPIR